MKKIAIMFSLGILMAGTSFAQNAPQKERKNRTEYRGENQDGVKKGKKTPEEMAQRRTQKMSEQLDLTSSQENQLQALNLKHAQEMRAMRASMRNTEDKAQAREAMKANHEKWQAELKGILSAQQFAKYEADRSEMKSRWEGKQGKGGKEHRGQKNQQRS